MNKLLPICFALLLAGCSDVATKNNPTNVSPNNANNGNNDECEGPATECGVCAQPDCVDGEWTCIDTACAPNSVQNIAEPNCVWSSDSTLQGASIAFAGDRCSWTVAEAAAGIEIPYTITITVEHQVMPTSQQNGCDEPGESGLRPQERVFGGEQSYCICDTGLCDGTPITVDLVAGEYDFAMPWDGVNWIGPSDFGNPKGEPFPPGGYTVEVRAIGTVVEGEEYELVGSMQITLTE